MGAWAGLAVNDLTLGGDPLGQGRDPIGSQASLHEDLDPAGIVDAVLGRDRVPQGRAMVAELAGWSGVGRAAGGREPRSAGG